MSDKTPYVSSSGTLTSQPLYNRISNSACDMATIVYLFFETLISPIANPASWTDPSARPAAQPARRSGGGGGGGGGNAPRPGGGSGFMTMGDIRGGTTVDGCRATCG
ncbi:hypothetical protein B9479_005768 [Cryptococcus floricola]|uniref:Uncharacterized protein n=1 Tax=Cryptococcus floricola TaxID=2591691 RepID=A0A5D3AU78_9TREE|nr:hypothetical protein B9479_005768 [Cryptococcus floricola]